METEDRGPFANPFERPFDDRGAGAGERTARDPVRAAKDMAQRAVAQGGEYVEGAREYVGQTVRQGRDKIEEYGTAGFERVRNDVTSFTRQQPMAALLVAAGLGVAIGWLSLVKRR